MKVSIYDVAREANVSTATVSRVLNNKSSVSPQTRQLVEQTIKKLSYHPSTIARGLVSKHTKTVGILTIDIRTPHYAATAHAMERELFKLGYSAILCNTGEEYAGNLEYLHMLEDKGVCGIMCIGSIFKNTFYDSSVLEQFSNIPFIFSNCVISAINSYSVVVNERMAMQLCVEHLIKRGYRDLFFVQDATSFSGCEKAAGFRCALQLAGLPGESEAVYIANRGISGGAAAADAIVASGKPFSGIIFGDDITAVGGLQRLQQLGYDIPGQVAIVGFNNSASSVCCTPKLTTVDYKTDVMGNMSVRMLEMVLSGKNVTRLLSVTPELVVRDST